MESALTVLVIVTIFSYMAFGEETPLSVEKKQLESNIFLLEKSGCNGRLSSEDCDKLLGRSKWFYIKKFKQDRQCPAGSKMAITLTLGQSKLTITEDLPCPEEKYNVFPLVNWAADKILNELGITFRMDIGKSGKDTIPILMVPEEGWEIPEKDTWDHGTFKQRNQRLEVAYNICVLKDTCSSEYGLRYENCHKVLSDAMKYYLQTYQWRKDAWKRCTQDSYVTRGTPYGIPCDVRCPTESPAWSNLVLTDHVLKTTKLLIRYTLEYEDMTKVLNTFPKLQIN